MSGKDKKVKEEKDESEPSLEENVNNIDIASKLNLSFKAVEIIGQIL